MPKFLHNMLNATIPYMFNSIRPKLKYSPKIPAKTIDSFQMLYV